jgi:colanic acid/amylovoran biosynthesis protein
LAPPDRKQCAAGAGLRILVEPSDYVLRNVGDAAMLQVAVRRLGELWPAARIQVFSSEPEKFPRFAPNAEPRVSGRFRPRLRELEHGIRRRWPALVGPVLRFGARRAGAIERDRALRSFLDAVRAADALIVTGMGGITDAFPEYATELLTVLRYAGRNGAVTALLGQGLGPLDDACLRTLAGTVLRSVDLIGLREDRAGGPLLRALGVSADRVVTTGDDAIELAYSARPAALGLGLGINVRAAGYSGVERTDFDRLREALQSAARACGAPLVAVPISRVSGERDSETIRDLAAGHAVVGASAADLTTPEAVTRQLHHCRVLVAGSYHAAVFALAEGIPAVGLARSPYYRDKFLGLAAQFGRGCGVLFLDDPRFPTKLRDAVGDFWRSAEDLRPDLIAAAERQIGEGHRAYARLAGLVRCRAIEA